MFYLGNSFLMFLRSISLIGIEAKRGIDKMVCFHEFISPNFCNNRCSLYFFDLRITFDNRERSFGKNGIKSIMVITIDEHTIDGIIMPFYEECDLFQCLLHGETICFFNSTLSISSLDAIHTPKCRSGVVLVLCECTMRKSKAFLLFFSVSDLLSAMSFDTSFRSAPCTKLSAHATTGPYQGPLHASSIQIFRFIDILYDYMKSRMKRKFSCLSLFYNEYYLHNFLSCSPLILLALTRMLSQLFLTEISHHSLYKLLIMVRRFSHFIQTRNSVIWKFSVDIDHSKIFIWDMHHAIG